MSEPVNDTAFLLPGGGSLGAVQVGMLKALEKHGIRARMYIGSSVGAVNAAFLASGPAEQTVPGLEKIWQSIKKSDIFPAPIVANLGTLLGFRNHFSESYGLRKLLQANLSYESLEQSAIPVAVSATNILTGEYRILQKGPAIEAVLASAAIPAVFQPVEINGEFLVDGSIASHIPVEPALRAGIKKLFILPTGFTCARKEPPKSALSMALLSVHIMLGRQLHAAIDTYGHKIEIVVVPPLCPIDTLMNDFKTTEELIHRACEQTDTWLNSQLPVNTVPAELEPHSH